MVLSMDRWVGKVAVVTGAAGGIGSVVCKQLVERGIKVAAVDVRHDELLSLSKDLQGKILPVEADLTKEADIVAAFKYIKEKLNSVDILINNAGIIQETNLIGGDAEKWRKIFDVNTIAFCICVREAIEIMKKDNLCGHIICVNSVCGHRVPNLAGLNVYPGSKHAVTALLKSWRNEVDQVGLNVKITGVSPGLVATQLNQNNHVSRERCEFINSLPQLKAEDVADAIMYCLSTPQEVQVQELILSHKEDTK